MAMEPNDSMNQDRFSAILENQRAIMVNQATILHNQNKIVRGLEQLFTFFPALQGSIPIQNTLPTTVAVAPIPSILGSGENSRGEQPPATTATQNPAGPPPSVSPSPRVENTTPINTPTRPQAPLNSSTPLGATTATQGPTGPPPSVSPSLRVENTTPINTPTRSQAPFYSSTPLATNPLKALPSSGASSPGSDNQNDVAPPVVRSAQYISQEELTQIKCKACSIGNFAVQLLRQIFTQSELDNKNCTGTRGKEAVDPDRLRFVKETVFDIYAIAADEKLNTWKHCVRAIDEYLRRPKRMAKLKIESPLNKTAMF
ncbi:hypothetical protein ACROYT_G019627 [Oculina patagonica]